MSIVRAYGVGIKSDLALDALPGASWSEDTISVQVQHAVRIQPDPGTPTRPCVAQGRSVHIVSYGRRIAVQVDALFSFELLLSENRIFCSVRNDVPDRLLRYWILQQILPLFLLLNGSTEFLHGMAVSARSHTVPQQEQAPWCVSFLGESYAGKSTLLRYFLDRGHALITDDHLALSRHDYTQVLPATPFYRPYRASEDLGIVADHFSNQPARLARVYLLSPAPSDSHPRIETLSGIDAVTALLPSIHYSLNDQAESEFFPLVADRFRGLAEIARKVPIARLYVPRSLDRLPEVYDLLQNDQLN